MQPFTGFDPRDFDAYLPAKWQSHMYNLERLRVKEKLGALGRQLSPLVPGPDRPPLAIEVSAESPALWNHNQVPDQQLWFLRSPEERKALTSRTRAKSMLAQVNEPSPQREHIYLAVLVRVDGLEVALRLYPDAMVDRDNLQKKMSDLWQAQSLADRVTSLPEGFRIRLGTADPLTPAETKLPQVQSLVEALCAAPTGAPLHESQALTLSHEHAREAVLASGADIAERIREDLGALLPLYHFIAWSTPNDFVQVKESIREEKQVKKTRGLRKGSTVRVGRGLLSGKTGVVMDIDKDGSLRVRLGAMVVKLEAADVEAV
jgi:transcription antitermination factor NusG